MSRPVNERCVTSLPVRRQRVSRKQRGALAGDLRRITLPKALGVGVAQMFALIPGVSRSGAAIDGGLLAGQDRATATASPAASPSRRLAPRRYLTYALVSIASRWTIRAASSWTR